MRRLGVLRIYLTNSTLQNKLREGKRPTKANLYKMGQSMFAGRRTVLQDYRIAVWIVPSWHMGTGHRRGRMLQTCQFLPFCPVTPIREWTPLQSKLALSQMEHE